MDYQKFISDLQEIFSKTKLKNSDDIIANLILVLERARVAFFTGIVPEIQEELIDYLSNFLDLGIYIFTTHWSKEGKSQFIFYNQLLMSDINFEELLGTQYHNFLGTILGYSCSFLPKHANAFVEYKINYQQRSWKQLLAYGCKTTDNYEFIARERLSFYRSILEPLGFQVDLILKEKKPKR